MSVHERFGAPPPGPLVESKIFNAGRPSVTLLVEAGFDERFWRTHATCLVRHHDQGGRAAVLRKLDAAKQHPDAVLLAVLDADLDRVEGCLVERDDVVWTDAHDLETTLACLPALDKLVRHKVGSEKTAEAEQRWGERLRERLFRHATGMGRLRWLKHREHIDGLVFKKPKKKELHHFDCYDRCTEDDWSPSLTHVINAVIAYSSAQHLLGRPLLDEIQALPAAPPEQVSNGHDVIGFLHAWIDARDRSDADSLARELALACDVDMLRRTAMWQAIRTWEDRHAGFAVLAQDAR